MSRTSSFSVAAAAVAAVLSISTGLQAHDFWLVPNAFRVGPGEEIEVRGQTSSRFPTSESAVDPQRVADARLLGAGEEVRLEELSISGPSLLLRHRPATAGQRLVAVALHPRSVRESAEGFRRYLELEGAPEALERYERSGVLPTDSVTRRYTKYAKTLLEVGTGGPRSFARIAGHPAEFVPLADPALVGTGDLLPFRLLYRGAPLAGAPVHAGSVPLDARSEEERAIALVTDAEGVVRLPIDRPGLWNVRALHVVPSDPGSGAEWDTHWVTLVFAVVGGASSTAGASSASASDSLSVAAVVQRYHAALTAGDSITALRLLRDDAIILESGVVETKEEYRSHHLPGDIAFARAVRRESGPVRVTVRGDVAWATSVSTTRGTYRDRPVNSQNVELMVLVREDGEWRITAIHWSSRPIRTPASE